MEVFETARGYARLAPHTREVGHIFSSFDNTFWHLFPLELRIDKCKVMLTHQISINALSNLVILAATSFLLAAKS